MNQTTQISKNITKSLSQKAPEVLETYKNYLDMLDDIEIRD